jgi:hypothetical protein
MVHPNIQLRSETKPYNSLKYTLSQNNQRTIIIALSKMNSPQKGVEQKCEMRDTTSKTYSNPFGFFSNREKIKKIGEDWSRQR